MLAALVLAGGDSTRMGRDKALVSVDGESLLARAVAAFDAVPVVDEIIISHGPSERATRYREALTRPTRASLVFVADSVEYAGAGPLAGLAAGLAAARAWLVLVSSVDLERVPARELGELAVRHGRGVVVAHGAHVEPLIGVYPGRAGASMARELLAKGERSAHGLASALSLDRVEPSVAGIPSAALRSLNRPSDFAE